MLKNSCNGLIPLVVSDAAFDLTGCQCGRHVNHRSCLIAMFDRLIDDIV
jgi:hypothetical protein